MARFRFRLETSLQLAKQVLETAEWKFAREVKRWQACVQACALQREHFNEAQEGQREVGRHQPVDLKIWQVYVTEQGRRLKQYEAERLEQEQVKDNARRIMIEAHREVEKFGRLKETRAQAFRLLELQKEQKVLDETSQIIHWHKRRPVKLIAK